MAPVTRSFTVFKDEPEVVSTPAMERKESQNGSSATYVLAPPPGPQLVYAPDKENINPLTGTRASADEPTGKKRKTALSVKAQASTASPTKRQRPLAEKATKKPAAKARAAEKKTKRTASKRAVSTRPHREPSLPRVAEENDAADQAVIDSKCKELTVLPLADISEAYDVAPVKEGAVASEKAEPTTETCVEAPPKTERAATPPAAEPKRASSPVPPASAASVFSTPERKRIYSAFTFTSPSPAAKRLASTRGSSVDRFSDAAF